MTERMKDVDHTSPVSNGLKETFSRGTGSERGEEVEE